MGYGRRRYHCSRRKRKCPFRIPWGESNNNWLQHRQSWYVSDNILLCTYSLDRYSLFQEKEMNMF